MDVDDQKDLSGIWKFEPGDIRLIIDMGHGTNVFVLYPDGFVCMLPRGHVSFYYTRCSARKKMAR